MKSILFTLFITLFTFLAIQGCAQKQLSSSIKNPVVIVKDIPTENDTSEFDDEFHDEASEIVDPLSGYNSVMTSFNDVMFTYILNPVSKVYAYVIPQPFRLGLSNAIKNINFPIRFTNNLLQGKLNNSKDELERFVINSTLGFAGLADVASGLNIPEHKEDFGQTLGYYGLGSGFHIVLPFLGPSNVRDLAGLTLDAYASPLVNVRGFEDYRIPDNFTQSTVIVAGYLVNKNSLELGSYESLKKDAIELYPFLRDTYEQKRDAQIKE